MSKKKFVHKKSLISGRHSVISALQNAKRICHELWITKESVNEVQAIVLNLNHQNLHIHVTDRKTIDSLVGEKTVHQGFALRAQPLVQPDLEDIVTSHRSSLALLVLDQITDPHNVGAILRSSAAFGINAVIQQDRHGPDPDNPTLAKTAAGAMEHIPLICVTNLSRCLQFLRAENIWCVGLDEKGSQTLTQTSFDQRIAFIMGAEGKGIRRLVRDNCDYLVRLPTQPKFSTLNVSNAAAITLYEWSRQSQLARL